MHIKLQLWRVIISHTEREKCLIYIKLERRKIKKAFGAPGGGVAEAGTHGKRKAEVRRGG